MSGSFFFVFYTAVGKSNHSSGDDSHLVDFLSIAAAAQGIDGSSQTLQDGAQSLVTAQTLCDLVADVTSFDGGEDEGVGVAGNGGAGELQLGDFVSDICV